MQPPPVRSFARLRPAALLTFSGMLCLACTGRPGTDGTPPEDILRAFAGGIQLYQSGNIAEAREAFRTIGRSHPRFLQNRYMEGKCAYLLEQYAEAIDVLSPAAAETAGFIDGTKWLARSYLALDRPADAIAVLEAAMEWSSEDAELLLLEAKAHRQAGRMEAALAAYRRAEAVSERFAEIQLGLAEIYRDAGFAARAAVHLERSLVLLGQESGLREPIGSILRGIREEGRK